MPSDILHTLLLRSCAKRTKGMAAVYLAPYHSYLKKGFNHDCVPQEYRAITQAIATQNWPYDYGDDPSFYCAETSGGRITWGVCRPDVRNEIRTGDAAVFFPFIADEENRTFEYKISAVATVERKVSHRDVFNDGDLKAEFGKYVNTLIRPNERGGWKHEEPSIPENDWHKDWVCRMAPRNCTEWRTLVEGCDALQSVGTNVIAHVPFVFGNNYVIFDKNRTFTLAMTADILAHSAYKKPEQWKSNNLVAATVYEWTVGFARRVAEKAQKDARFLKIPNKTQHPHSPCIRWYMPQADVETWRESFRGELYGLGLL